MYFQVHRMILFFNLKGSEQKNQPFYPKRLKMEGIGWKMKKSDSQHKSMSQTISISLIDEKFVNIIPSNDDHQEHQ